MAITDTLTASSYLPNVTRYEDVATAAPQQNEAMGQQQFLQLFTAQLQNQNPLDPVKNEAFVAQLAQFSQLEALTNMQSSLENFVNSMSSERLLGSAGLIGKTVAVENAPIAYQGQTDVAGVISLPVGASGVAVQVTNSTGQVVRNMIFGPQTPGDFSMAWDGFEDSGALAPNGTYRLSAKAVSNETTVDVPVSTVTPITAVLTDPADGSIRVEVQGGTTIALTDIKRVGQ
jgi:flagellar basal-body rod modification protein FlgD